MARTANCKFCKNPNPLIRSHIIQKAFHNQMAEGHHSSVKIFPRDAKDHPKKRPGGLYDDYLVCESCEQLFSPYDDYGYRFLTEEVPKTGVPINSVNLGIRVDHFDYPKLKLYLLSTLWRASNTSNEFFSAVSVGEKFNRQLIKMIQTGDPGRGEDFSIVISLFKEEEAKLGYPPPNKFKFGDRTFYRLCFGGYAFDIKVDSRPCKEKYQSIILSPNQPVIILKFSFSDSYNYQELFRRFSQIDEYLE